MPIKCSFSFFAIKEYVTFLSLVDVVLWYISKCHKISFNSTFSNIDNKYLFINNFDLNLN